MTGLDEPAKHVSGFEVVAQFQRRSWPCHTGLFLFLVEMEVCFLEVAGLGCSYVLGAGCARLFYLLG